MRGKAAQWRKIEEEFDQKFDHFNSDYFGTGGSGKQICDPLCEHQYDLTDVLNFFREKFLNQT